MAFNRDNYKKTWDSKRQKYNTALIQRWKMFKGCTHCGFKGHFAALCLDHVEPELKDRNRKGTRAINLKWGKDRIKAELAKCQVLCTNCHQIRTWQCAHFKFRARQGSTDGGKG